MTANKHFKRQVRARAARTGESYAAALSHIRSADAKESRMDWRRFEKPEYGYTIDLPAQWVEQPPDLRNSPLETARFVDPDDRRRSVIVFRTMPMPGATAQDLAERTRTSLERHGWLELTLVDAHVGAEHGVRLDAVKRDAGRVLALREYLVAHDPVGLILAVSTTAPDEDDALIDTIADRFRFLGD